MYTVIVDIYIFLFLRMINTFFVKYSRATHVLAIKKKSHPTVHKNVYLKIQAAARQWKSTKLNYLRGDLAFYQLVFYI